MRPRAANAKVLSRARHIGEVTQMPAKLDSLRDLVRSTNRSAFQFGPSKFSWTAQARPHGDGHYR